MEALFGDANVVVAMKTTKLYRQSCVELLRETRLIVIIQFTQLKTYQDRFSVMQKYYRSHVYTLEKATLTVSVCDAVSFLKQEAMIY